MKSDWMRGGLAIALLGAFASSLFALFLFQVPEANRDLVNFMLGQLSIMAVGALGYYFNTSKSSQDKNNFIQNLTDVPSNTLPLDGFQEEKQ